MDNVYIDKRELNGWIAKYFPTKDLISIDDLLGCIEDLDSEKEKLIDEIDRLKEYLGYDECSKSEYYNEEYDREIEKGIL